MATNWSKDILGRRFERTTIEQGTDYAGAVSCTIVRLLPQGLVRKGVLYVHGFSDYFFQRHLAEAIADAGFAFYAVDLRKYGRSLQPGQRMMEVRDLHEYFDDIDAAVRIMKDDGVHKAALMGHSTGGLTTALYMAERKPHFFRTLILNSPFLDWNLPKFVKRLAIPVVAALGRIFPYLPVHQAPDAAYAKSLSQWDYNHDWKRDILPDPDAGWVRAITRAHRRLRKLSIHVPVLLMHSSRSATRHDDDTAHAAADAILNVADIARYGRQLGPKVTEVVFEDGLHDLSLSTSEQARKQFLNTIICWLQNHL